MPEGEPLDPKAGVISGAALRELWRNLESDRAARHPSPSPVFDPEVGLTTSHNQGVW